MNQKVNLFIDLLGEEELILADLKNLLSMHLQEQKLVHGGGPTQRRVDFNLESFNFEHSHLNGSKPEDSRLKKSPLVNFHLNTFAQAVSASSAWSEHFKSRDSVSSTSMVFLIYPTQKDPHSARAMQAWRSVLEQTPLHPQDSVQIIRGDTKEEALQNARYAFINGLENLSIKAPLSLLRPPIESNYARLGSFACEKCSDPECEHKLFNLGLLK